MESIAIDTLDAMCMQEKFYVCGDYLHQQDVEDCPHGPLNGPAIDCTSREHVVQWCFDVADLFKFNHETVVIAVSYFDRFLCTPVGKEVLQNKFLIQLASMTCFYSAVKINEKEVISSKHLARLSHGLYSLEQVEEMERTILQALQWRVNPPTPQSFVREILALFPASPTNDIIKGATLDLAQLQIELSVKMYEFSTVKASEIAVACMMNALESLGTSTEMIMPLMNFCLCRVTPDHTTESLHNLRCALYQSVMESQPSLPPLHTSSDDKSIPLQKTGISEFQNCSYTLRAMEV